MQLKIITHNLFLQKNNINNNITEKNICTEAYKL